jgi:hypothetical protein
MVRLRTVTSDADVIPSYTDAPIYIPAFKLVISFGHFITFSSENQSIVGQLLRHDINTTTVVVSILLPLYDAGTLEHIGSPHVLPNRVVHPSCVNSCELVMICKVAVVPVCCIRTLGFDFLAIDVTEYKNHIHGMTHSFLIRFKYRSTDRSLVELNSDTFVEFPDLHPEHQQLFCESFGRSIFSSINVLRQELWRTLCRYGQGQGCL